MSSSVVPRGTMHPRSAVVGFELPRPATRAGWRATPWTTALVVGAVAACVGAAALTVPGVAGRVGADPDLARLLRAMALVKGVLVALGAGAVIWRLRRPTPRPFAAAYLGLVWAAGGATGALWQLAGVGRAAVALHAAGALLVVLAWRDRAFFPHPANR